MGVVGLPCPSSATEMEVSPNSSIHMVCILRIVFFRVRKSCPLILDAIQSTSTTRYRALYAARNSTGNPLILTRHPIPNISYVQNMRFWIGWNVMACFRIPQIPFLRDCSRFHGSQKSTQGQEDSVVFIKNL